MILDQYINNHIIHSSILGKYQSYTPQNLYTHSAYNSPYISYGTEWENLSDDL